MKKTAAMLMLMGTVVPGLALAQAQPTAPSGLSAAQARSAMYAAGCSSTYTASSLAIAPDGNWHGQCQKGGVVTNVMVDGRGTVTNVTGQPPMMTEGQARYALTDFGCGSTSISNLGPGPNGSWHGQCQKGGALTNVMVDAQGKASAMAAPASHITEAQARYALVDFGCSSTYTSALSQGPDGSWVGQCQKGGAITNVAVDKTGKAMAR